MPEETEVVDTPVVETPVVETPKSWYDELDADLKANPSITKFKAPGELAKSYVELSKTLGKDKVVLPTDKSTPEEWKAFWKKVGAPEKDSDYDVGDDDMPEPIRISPEAKSALQKKAIELGVPKHHFEELFKTFKGLTETKFKQETDKVANLRGESETELRKEWGAAYDAKVTGAQKVIDTFFKDKGVRPEFQILANDKGFIKAMADIAESISEDKIAGVARTSMTPQEAQQELNNIVGNMKGPYYNELHPEHDAMVQKVLDLQAMVMRGQG